MKKIIIFLLLANIKFTLNCTPELSEINTIYAERYLKSLDQINTIANKIKQEEKTEFTININNIINISPKIDNLINSINKFINIERPLTRYFIKQYLGNLEWIPYFYLDSSEADDESSTNLICEIENKETKEIITITFKNFSNLINQQNIINYENNRENTPHDNYNNISEEEFDELAEIYTNNRPKKHIKICEKVTICITSILAIIAIILPENMISPANFFDLLQN